MAAAVKAQSADRQVQGAEGQDVKKAEERVVVMIPSDDSDMGRDDVSVGFNGEVIRIQRDREVSIRMGHYNALMDAVKTEPVLDESGKVVGMRRVPRYNVQRMR